MGLPLRVGALLTEAPHHDALCIDAVLLAGGEGRRMGGQDKGLLLYRGQPLVAHGLQALVQQSYPLAQIWISANRHLAQYRAWGYPVVSDTRTARIGPLAGLEAVLAYVEADAVLTVPCDTPHLPPDVLARLAQALVPGVRAVYACTPERAHPSVALYRVQVEADLHAYLAAGQRSVMGFLTAVQAQPVLLGAADDFVNLNTPGDLLA